MNPSRLALFTVSHTTCNGRHFCLLNLTVSDAEWYVTLCKEKAIFVSARRKVISSLLLPPPPKKLVIEVLGKFLLFLFHIICVDSLKPRTLALGAAVPVLASLSLSHLCSYNSLPPSPQTAGPGALLALLPTSACLLDLPHSRLCSSPEFHLLWPLIYSNLRWFMSGSRL